MLTETKMRLEKSLGRSPTEGLIVTTIPKYFQSPGLQGFKSPALFPHQLGELGSAPQSPLELTERRMLRDSKDHRTVQAQPTLLLWNSTCGKES